MFAVLPNAAAVPPGELAAPWRSGAVLPPPDAERYRQIFALQRDGDWPAADRLIDALSDPLLLGPVLAQRYLHPTRYKSGYPELAAWLERYGDHPQAQRIYKLALARKPNGQRGPRRPESKKDSLAAAQPLDVRDEYHSNKRLNRSQRRMVRRYKLRIRWNLDRLYLSKTARLLEKPKLRRLFDAYELDQAYDGLAAGWLYYGEVKRAFKLASEIAKRRGERLPTAHWTAGLAAWRLGKIEAAAGHFAALAAAQRASDWNRAAGAYWAARAQIALLSLGKAQRWLQAAAGYDGTFYGMIAQRRLNQQTAKRHGVAPFGLTASDALKRRPGGRRALALVQAGSFARAEGELLRLNGWQEAANKQAILALSQRAGLAQVSLEVARRELKHDQPRWSAAALLPALYPVPAWQPDQGFALDRALVFAFMRQESAFDPAAKSPSGARGLMQLMPRTAAWLDRSRRYRGKGRDVLFDPQLNITLGQRYLQRLLDSKRVSGDVLRLTVAYNAGPGNLRQWERRMKHGGDPLIFIECLPSRETRLFAERVLTNLWMYRRRFGQGAPTLDALADNRWPVYQPVDGSAQIAAWPPAPERRPIGR